MAYLKINKTRFAYLLRFGVGDDELRRFFSDKRIALIQKGGRVQNPPRGNEARITAMVSLPSSTEPIVQKWFSANLTMLDPEDADELVETFRMYEAEEESLPESDSRRLSRSCLIHLFSENPPQRVVDFLKSPLGRNGSEPDSDDEPDSHQDSENEAMHEPTPPPTDSMLLNTGLAAALVALVEGKDPDEFVSGLPPAIASFVTGLHAIKEGHAEEAQSAREELEKLEPARSILSAYEARQAKARESSKSPGMSGIRLIRFEENDKPEFDSDRDEIIGICTKSFPENSVFVRPFAIRTGSGEILSLGRQDQREATFPTSGDVMSFQGRPHPKQPKRGEIGIWHVTPNEGPATYRTNYHLTGTKISVYEVRPVPFKSNEYDSVREYIKEQISRESKNPSGPLLFLLRDDLIVGCPPGKDLSKDEGFEQGLHCWRALIAFSFEGRILVPGPLPASEQYECETLASALKKFLSSKRTDSEKLTKAQQKYLLDALSSGEAQLNAARSARLLEELGFIEKDEGAIDLLLEEAMKDEAVTARIEKLIQDKVDEQTGKKSELTKELDRIEKRLAELKEKLSKQEKEQKALPTAVSKAIKDSIKKAKGEALGTLGQVVVFSALMDELDRTHAAGNKASPNTFRSVEPGAPYLETLRSLGVSLKHARALELTGDVAFATGLFLVIEGTAARLAAEAWGSKNVRGNMIMDCGIGMTEDTPIREIAADETRSIVILDANLSPIDVYARPLIDRVQREIATSDEDRKRPKILMSLSDSVAGLPLPRSVDSLALRVSLDSSIEFLRDDDLLARLEDAESDDAGESWASPLWKPALKVLLAHLKGIPPAEAALVIAVLEAGHS